MAHLGGVPYYRNTTSIVDKVKEIDNINMVSSLQLKHGLRKGHNTYLGALMEIKPVQLVGVHDNSVEILLKFNDVTSLKLPKVFPLWRVMATRSNLLLVLGPSPKARIEWCLPSWRSARSK